MSTGSRDQARGFPFAVIVSPATFLIWPEGA